jgi:hypothetical protein
MRLALLLSPLAVLAADGFTDTPVLPGTQWHVHDPARPQPVKVAPGKAICQTTPAPSGAVVVFDGKSVDGWQPADGAKKPQLWELKDGTMIARGNDLRTKAAFGSGHYHVEWRIPAGRKVKGQSGGNSGVYLLSMYEIQVMEGFANSTYADGSAGAIYGQTPPALNACLPQGEWQSYDIIFTAPTFDASGNVVNKARITVVHNGVTVQDNIEILGPTVWRKLPNYKAHPEKLPLLLQFHGDPIEFRNIWVAETKASGK